MLPYGRQSIDDDDIAAVTEALRADFLTTGPRVEAFEEAFAAAVGATHAVACSSGTAALHLALLSLGIGPGDVCIVPSITFVATANAVRHCGAEVVFADVDPHTGLMTQETLGDALGRAPRRISAVLPVHLRGDICVIDTEFPRIEDACHALGAQIEGIAVYSFHPVKTITTGEGGMITTADAFQAAHLRHLRNHGQIRDHEMHELGFNYRLPDFACALGMSQLAKLPRFVKRRRELAERYKSLLEPLVEVPPIPEAPHLMTVLVENRDEIRAALRARKIGSQIHYRPVHTQPYYQARYGDLHLPGAEAWYARCLSLPLYPSMEDSDVDRVAKALTEALA